MTVSPITTTNRRIRTPICLPWFAREVESLPLPGMKARLIETVLQIVDLLKRYGISPAFMHSAADFSDNLSGPGQMVQAIADCMGE